MSAPTTPSSRLREALAAFSDTVERLSLMSERSYQNPYTAVEWPATVDPDTQHFSSPEYLSLYGTPQWDTLDETTRRRLGFHEAANFYSINIHGEKGLIEGLAARLYRRDLMQVSDYLHHFLDEENKHSIFFGGFCTRYARVYPNRQLPFAEERSRDVEDLLFFTKTMIFEEIVDRYNWVQGRDERLEPVARFINHNHHFEESRHLIFGRKLVAALWQAHSPDWSAETIADIRENLTQSFVATWREYYNPDVYSDVGLDDPWEVAENAWNADYQKQHRRDTSAKVLTELKTIGILTEEPSDAF